jgi:endonuclease/exonuclease/phosphatase family metal-dependent hydrolase
MKIKIMQYNLLNGFCADLPPYKTDQKRLLSASKAIQNMQPDILVLNEAYFWHFAIQKREIVWKDFFKKLYSLPIPAENQFRWAPALITKFPIISFDTSVSFKDFKVLIVKLKINSQPVQIISYHPHPSISEEKKAAHLNNIFKDLSLPTIFAGDLNAISPQDLYDRRTLEMGFSKFLNGKAGETIKDMFTFSTITNILNYELTDTFIAAKKPWKHTMPTPVRSKEEDSRIRIDYIFCSKHFKIIDSDVIQNKYTKAASDHYPIYAVLEFK